MGNYIACSGILIVQACRKALLLENRKDSKTMMVYKQVICMELINKRYKP